MSIQKEKDITTRKARDLRKVKYGREGTNINDLNVSERNYSSSDSYP
jgi:hypothetical protein